MDKIIYFEQGLPFWSELNNSEKEMIEQSSIKAKYEKGVLLHHSEQGCKGIMLVLSGQLRTYIVSDEGREVTLFRIRQGETCVLSGSCLMDSIVFDVMIEAVEDTEVITIPSSVLSQIMKEHSRVEVYLYKTAAERFSDVMWTMQQILFMGADRRVAIFLWDELTKSKHTTICLTHDEIARYIGSAREVVTKVLKYFVQEGVVTLGRGKIEVIDKNKLRKYL
ncbi:MAG TPA: Crp/Fnr family transcriptional regulator [Clostridium sp.]|nr:Crp/Fnr family transcriptional regulator [Clostridium sp.]